LALRPLFALAPRLPAAAKDAPRSFSLSTTRTFAPGESVKIQLFARNVPGARVSRLQSARRGKVLRRPQRPAQLWRAALVAQASRSTSAPGSSACTTSRRICGSGPALLPRPVYDDARDSFREQPGQPGQAQPVVGAAEFAQIPLLNESQLVARWKLETPPALVSETQQLPIDNLARAST
jgi:hypothetical protein